jgi:hypothetical protein
MPITGRRLRIAASDDGQGIVPHALGQGVSRNAVPSCTTTPISPDGSKTLHSDPPPNQSCLTSRLRWRLHTEIGETTGDQH